MECRPQRPPTIMEHPNVLNLPPEIQRLLKTLPSPIALELEDHLLEEYSRHLRDGETPERALQLTAERFGELLEIAPACAAVAPNRWWLRREAPVDFKLVVVGWMILSVFMASRICFASTPSHTSIVACLLTGLSCACLGAGFLRRSGTIVWASTAFALGTAIISFFVPLRQDIADFIVSGCALEPILLEVIAVFSVLSMATAWKEARARKQLALTYSG